MATTHPFFIYFTLARLAWQRQLTYRAANVAGLLTNAFFGALRAYVLLALFGARDNVAGYSVQAAITYTGLTQALLSYVAIFGWWELIRTIRSGEVAADLSRPLDFFWYWWAQDLGRAAGQLLWRGLPIMLLYALAYQIALPPTALHWLALFISLLLGLMISFTWRFLVSLSAFWAQDAIGIGRLAWTIAMFLSGFLMPVAFFPPWLNTLMHLTPFPAMISTSMEIYLGLISKPALPAALAIQLLWAIILYWLCRLALAAGVRKLVIQGG
ncbi:MAG: ABC-2 family transporter protein [Deinococcus sp.]|nr:ABC-2 family transporter protein [Deinococcus sp.]